MSGIWMKCLRFRETDMNLVWFLYLLVLFLSILTAILGASKMSVSCIQWYILTIFRNWVSWICKTDKPAGTIYFHLQFVVNNCLSVSLSVHSILSAGCIYLSHVSRCLKATAQSQCCYWPKRKHQDLFANPSSLKIYQIKFCLIYQINFVFQLYKSVMQTGICVVELLKYYLNNI